MSRGVLAVLGGILALTTFLGGRSEAQVTQVTSSGLGTAVNPVGAVYEITGGTRPGGGTNLFHSFGRFGTLAGETALFKDPAPPPTTNVIGRVTGGVQSNILGTIDTATYYPGANLFLINPAGIVFGATAQLYVGGSVNISTADYLRLTDGARFEAIPGAQDALLSSAPVAAFGFLGAPLNPITFEGNSFTMQPGKSLTVVGGLISLSADPLSGAPTVLSAPSGQVRLASVASAGELLESNLQSVPNIYGDSFLAVGTLAVDQGMVKIQDGQLVIDPSPGFMLMTASTFPGAITAAEVEISGKSVQLANGLLLSQTVDDPGPNITLSGGQISLTGGFSLWTDTAGNGAGGTIRVAPSEMFSMSGLDQFGNPGVILSTTVSATGGPIVVQPTTATNSGTVVLADGSLIWTQTAADGNAGNITIQTGTFNLTGSGILTSGSAGSSGIISINADTVSLSGQSATFPFSSIRSENLASGPTGAAMINARQLLLDGSARIEIESLGNQSGALTVSATGSVSITGNSKIRVSTQDATGSLLTVSAPTVTMNQGSLQTNTIAAGDAGTIAVNAGNLSISGPGAGLFSETTGAGAGGTIMVQAAQSVNLSNGATISSNSTGTGNAGNISITANQVNLFDSSITTQAALASGGNVTIMAGELVRLNNSQINTSVAGEPTTAGGDIMIDPPFVVLQNNSHIFAQAFAGLGGNITIVASGLFIDPSSSISASSQLGISGSVNVQSPVFFLSGTLVPLPKNPVQAASLLQQRCAARMQGSQESNFIQRGRDGLPPEPGGWLTSPMPAAGSPSMPRIGEAEPPPVAPSTESSLTRLASMRETAGCGLELVLAQ